MWLHAKGGDCSKVQGQLAGGVQALFPAQDAFAALKADGSVVAWSFSFWGVSRLLPQRRLIYCPWLKRSICL